MIRLENSIFKKIEKRQTILFSATITPKTSDLAKLSFKKELIYVGIDDIKEEATFEGLQQVISLLKVSVVTLCLKILVKR